MSVQALSRITALLALDADELRDYIPTFNDDDEDINEGHRAKLVEKYNSQLQGNEIKDLLADGDFNAIYQYLAANLERPVPEGNENDDGSTGG